MTFLFRASLIGFIASVAVNVLTYFGSACGRQSLLVVTLAVICLPLPFISTKQDLLTLNVAMAYKIVAILLVLYSLLLFIQPEQGPGVVTKEGQGYVRQNRGKVIRDASREEYLQAELKDARLGSSLALKR